MIPNDTWSLLAVCGVMWMFGFACGIATVAWLALKHHDEEDE